MNGEMNKKIDVHGKHVFNYVFCTIFLAGRFSAIRKNPLFSWKIQQRLSHFWLTRPRLCLLLAYTILRLTGSPANAPWPITTNNKSELFFFRSAPFSGLFWYVWVVIRKKVFFAERSFWLPRLVIATSFPMTEKRFSLVLVRSRGKKFCTRRWERRERQRWKCEEKSIFHSHISSFRRNTFRPTLCRR